MELSKVQREIISRSAMAVLAGAILFGSYKCFAAANDIRGDYDERHSITRKISNPLGPLSVRRRNYARRDASGAAFPMLLGIVLLLLGGPLALAAVTPTGMFAKMFSWNINRSNDEDRRVKRQRNAPPW